MKTVTKIKRTLGYVLIPLFPAGILVAAGAPLKVILILFGSVFGILGFFLLILWLLYSED